MNVAEAFVEQLNQQGVDFIFINPGTDTAPMLEVIAGHIAKGFRPRLL